MEGLRKRFHELYTEFAREGKHEHRNELVFLLDELLRQGGVNRSEYKQLNNVLAESLGTGKEEEGEEEEVNEESANEEEESAEEDKTEDESVKKLIQATVEYLIQHGKTELLELMNEISNRCW